MHKHAQTRAQAQVRAQEHKNTDSRAQILGVINSNSFHAVKKSERKVRSWHSFYICTYVHCSAFAVGRVTRDIESLSRKNIMPLTVSQPVSKDKHIRILQR